jgi:outer membrane autotransporter protein
VIVDGGTIAFSDGMIAVGEDPGTGLTLQNGAVLDAGTGFALTGNMMVLAGSTFDGTGGGAGVYTISGNLLNDGIVTTQVAAVGDSVSVAGDYAGTGQLLVDVDFANEISDLLSVGGDVTGGTTIVDVNDISVGTATGNDVLEVGVAGATADGDFALSGEVVSGAFIYDLNLVGGGWYLQADVLNQVEALAPTLTIIQDKGRDYLGNLWERVGHREAGWSAESRGDGSGMWGRAHGKLLHAGADVNSTGSEFETTHGFLQAGVDFAGFDLGEGGDLVLSVMGHYGASDTDVDNADGTRVANADITGYGVGGSVTFYNGDKNFYLDAVGQATWYDVKTRSIGRKASGKTDGFGYAGSLEAGYRYAISDQWSFVPQGQITYSNADFDNFTDTDDVVASVLKGESLEGRIGIALEGHSDVSFGYFRLNLIDEFMGDNKILASGATFETDVSGASLEMSAGGSFLVSHGVSLHTDFTGRTGLEKELHSFRDTVGVKVNW